MAEYGFFMPSAGRTLIAGLLSGETLEISRVMVGTPCVLMMKTFSDFFSRKS